MITLPSLTSKLLSINFVFSLTFMFPRFCQFRWYRRVKILFFSSLICCLCLHYFPSGNNWLPFVAPVRAQTTSVHHLIQQGISDYQKGDFQGAIEVWHQAVSEPLSHETDETVIVRQYLANAYQQLGQLGQAITQLDHAIALYHQAHDALQVGRLMTAQAQVYSGLGQHRRALRLLCDARAGAEEGVCASTSALGIAQEQDDALGEAAALGSLGNAYRLQGQYELAIQAFETSLTIAGRLEQVDYQTAALNGLGNVYASLAFRSRRYRQLAKQSNDVRALDQFQQASSEQNQEAITHYQRSLELALAQGDRLSELQSRMNLIEAYYQQQSEESFNQLTPMIHAVSETLNNLPDSRQKAYSLIRLANLIQRVAWGPAGFTLNPATQCAASPWSPKLTDF